MLLDDVDVHEGQTVKLDNRGILNDIIYHYNIYMFSGLATNALRLTKMCSLSALIPSSPDCRHLMLILLYCIVLASVIIECTVDFVYPAFTIDHLPSSPTCVLDGRMLCKSTPYTDKSRFSVANRQLTTVVCSSLLK